METMDKFKGFTALWILLILTTTAGRIQASTASSSPVSTPDQAGATASPSSASTTPNTTASTTQPATTSSTAESSTETTSNTVLTTTTPRIVPAVENITTKGDGPTAVILSWAKPPRTTNITYNVNYTSENGTSKTATADRESISITGLNPGFKYTFVVTYTQNQDGTISEEAKVDFVVAPGSPENVTVESKENSLNISWVPPVNGRVDNYNVSLNGTLYSKTISGTTWAFVDNLEAGTMYTVTVFATSQGKYGQPKIHNSATEPSTPVNLTVDTRDTNRVVISWKVSGGYLEFELKCNEDVLKKVKNLTGECTGLKPGAKLTASVVTIGPQNKTSSASKILESVTVPSPAKTLMAKAVNTTSIKVEWTKDEGSGMDIWVLKMDPAEGFLTNTKAIASNETSLASNETSLASNETSLGVSGLTPGRLYKFSIIAQSVDPATQEKYNSSQRTAEDRTQPMKPTNLTAKTTSSQLTAKWSVKGDYDLFVAKISPEPITGKATFKTNETKAVFENLRPGTKYTISVETLAGKKRSGEVKKEFYTNEIAPSKVQKLTIEPQSSTSLKVSWKPPTEPNGIIQGYAVLHYFYKGNSEDVKNITGKEMTETVLEGLQKWKEYNVSVAARNSAGLGEWESGIGKTWEDVPSAPVNVAVTSATSSSLKIKWESPSSPNGNILEYEVKVTNLTDGKYKSKPTKHLEMTVDGLVPYTNYSVTIRAKTSKGFGSWSDAINSRTDQDKPSAPGSVSVKETTSTYLQIKWETPSPPNGVILGYEVKVTNLTDQKQEKRQTKDLEVTVDGLVPYTNYSVIIRANTSKGFGNWSEAIYSRTDEGIPSEPRILRASDVKPDSMIIWWSHPEKPNGVITNYTISYGQKGHSTETISTNDNSTNITIGKLLPCTNYSFEVRAFTSVGPGKFSNVYNRTTDANIPGTPSDLKLVSKNATALTLTWTRPNETCDTMYYVIVHDVGNSISKDEEPIRVGNQTLPTKVTTTIPNLKSYWPYKAKVTAKNKNLLGVHSKYTKEVRTLESKPGLVQKFEVTVCNTCYTRVTLNWSPPQLRERNGIITKYRVMWKIEGNSKPYIKEYSNTELKQNWKESLSENIWAGMEHTFTIAAATSVGFGPESKAKTVTTKTGTAVPVFSKPGDLKKALEKGTGDVEYENWHQFPISLETQLFNMTNGDIQNIGVVVVKSEKKKSLNVISYENGWKKTLENGQSNGKPYLISDLIPPPSTWKKERPSRKKRSAENNIITIGKDTSCRPDHEAKYCNAPLQPETKYCVVVIAYTKGVPNNPARTACVEFETGAEPAPLGAIFGGLGAAFVLLIVFLVIVMVIKRRRNKDDADDSKGFGVEMGNVGRGGVDNPAYVITDEFGDEIEVSKPKPINLRSFPAIVSQMHHDDGIDFDRQFKLLEKVSPIHPMVRSTQNESIKAKNRYINILPYDHSLVHLVVPEGQEMAEAAGYTNANYIPGNNHKREYIACQGPLDNTIADFWHMVMEQNISTIIMLTKLEESGRKKCSRYWPRDTHPVQWGDVRVQLQSESVMKDYVIRMIEITQGQNIRKVIQFHFLSWPDWGKPDSAAYLLNFIDVVKNHKRSSDVGPKLVHCSAGIGRTGTFITVERLLEQITRQPTISVFDTVLNLREHRKGMVQGIGQYTYIHDCMKDAIEHKLAKKELTLARGSPGIKAMQNGNFKV